MLTLDVGRRGGKPSRRSKSSVPTKTHAVQANEYRLCDPNVRDDSDGVQPTREVPFDVKGCRKERAKTERHDRSYTTGERSSDDNRQRRRKFADNKNPDTWPVLSSLFPSRTPTSSRHAEKRIG